MSKVKHNLCSRTISQGEKIYLSVIEHGLILSQD